MRKKMLVIGAGLLVLMIMQARADVSLRCGDTTFDVEHKTTLAPLETKQTRSMLIKYEDSMCQLNTHEVKT